MSTPSMHGFKPREWFLIVRHKEMALSGRPTGAIQTAMSIELLEVKDAASPMRLKGSED